MTSGFIHPYTRPPPSSSRQNLQPYGRLLPLLTHVEQSTAAPCPPSLFSGEGLACSSCRRASSTTHLPLVSANSQGATSEYFPLVFLRPAATKKETQPENIILAHSCGYCREKPPTGGLLLSVFLCTGDCNSIHPGVQSQPSCSVSDHSSFGFRRLVAEGCCLLPRTATAEEIIFLGCFFYR